MSSASLRRVATLATVLLSLASCGGGGGSAGGPPPREVGIVTVQAEPHAVTTELPGRVEPYRVAEVRARATGIVLERTFQEGAEVQEGDVLFRIDPEPLQAVYDSALAALKRAEAAHTQARLRAERYAPLVETRAVSQQDHDDAVAARDAAAAEVAVARAAVRTARLNLDYATVRAPITGRIGKPEVTEGALVSAAAATPLATVQQLDPVYVDLTQSAAEVLALRRALESGRYVGLREGEATVTVQTEDGHTHPHPGRLLFTDITVDPTTGAVTLRAEVPNPDAALLPGMYVRARLKQAVVEDAILVPQQAVIRDAMGATVRVLDDEDRVQVRRVVVGDAADGARWVILEGLRDGDRVIVDGHQRIGPGMQVAPVPWEPVARATTEESRAAADDGRAVGDAEDARGDR